jgi:hypothetical protein
MTWLLLAARLLAAINISPGLYIRLAKQNQMYSIVKKEKDKE